MSEYDNWSASGRAPAEQESELREALSSEEVPHRRNAALGLVEAAESGLVETTCDTLAGVVRRDDDPEVRQFAVEALGVAGARPGTIRVALADTAEWVRAEAVVALARTVPEDTETLSVPLSDESGWVRRNAVIALGKVGGIDQSDLVDCIKNDPHPSVREYAAQYLADVAEEVPEAVRILAALLAREPNAFVRAKAARSLGELGTDRAEQALEHHGVTDSSDDVARTTKRALATARGVDPDALQLDVEVTEPAPPGSGRKRPDFRPEGHGGVPGGAPGFDPETDLDARMEDR